MIENCESYMYDLNDRITCVRCEPGYVFDAYEIKCIKNDISDCAFGVLKEGSRAPDYTGGFSCL